jgi:Flp pilus assembly protein TadD
MLKHTLSYLAVLFILVLPGQAGFAAGGNDPPTITTPRVQESPDMVAGRAAVEAKNWPAALGAFGKVVANEPNNPNGHNMLAYSYRKSGNLDMAFKHYNEALRIDPKHRAAHEYLGEAYLMANNLAKAEEHLKVLDGLCFFGCEEYSDLKKAVAEYRQKTANK